MFVFNTSDGGFLHIILLINFILIKVSYESLYLYIRIGKFAKVAESSIHNNIIIK